MNFDFGIVIESSDCVDERIGDIKGLQMLEKIVLECVLGRFRFR